MLVISVLLNRGRIPAKRPPRIKGSMSPKKDFPEIPLDIQMHRDLYDLRREVPPAAISDRRYRHRNPVENGISRKGIDSVFIRQEIAVDA